MEKKKKLNGNQVCEKEHQQMILSENARMCAQKAIKAAKDGKIGEAYCKLKKAEIAVTQAKQVRKEISQENQKVTISMINSEDHVMTTDIFVSLAFDFVELYEKMEEG